MVRAATLEPGPIQPAATLRFISDDRMAWSLSP